MPAVQNRVTGVRGPKPTGSAEHSGDGPKHLGEEIERPKGQPTQAEEALTRAEYYLYKFSDEEKVNECYD